LAELEKSRRRTAIEPSQVKKRCARLRNFAQVEARPNVIVTSPLPRAAQTAEIAADYLKAKLFEEDLLGPAFGTDDLQKLLKRHGADSVMIVGHEPSFTEVISELTGASLKLSKAGLALVEIDSESKKGRLLWLFPPKFARKAK